MDEVVQFLVGYVSYVPYPEHHIFYLSQAAGNLKSGSQIVVVQESPQTIVIQSANPQVVCGPALMFWSQAV